MNTLSSSVQLLSEAEKQKFAKFRLPLIPCPSCGESHKGSLLNLGFNRNCVSCGDSMELGEISQEGLRKLEYIKLDVEKIGDQKLITQFRDNILWMCDHCGKGNLNLKKKKNGSPTSGKNVGCEGCGSEYTKGENLLPFVSLKGYGFDDGDDSDDSYELSMLFKTQGLWFECIKKALEDGGNDEARTLFKKLESEKLRTPKIVGNTRGLKNGEYAISFMLEYLGVSDGDYSSVSINSSGAIIEEHAEIFEIVERTKKDVSKAIIGNKKILLPTIGASIIGILVLVNKTHEIEMQGAYHDSSVLFEEKGTHQKQYNLERHEPELNLFDNVVYDISRDISGFSQYQAYAQQSDFYRLKKVGNPELVSGGIVNLDTGDDRKIVIPNACPEPSSSSSSGGGFSSSGGGSYSSGGGSSSSSGSSGVGFGGGGSLFMGPKGIELEDKTIRPEGDIVENTLQASIINNVIGILTMSGTAHAGSCDIVTYEDIIVKAERKFLVQNYSVWDWKSGVKISSQITEGIDYIASLERLEKGLVQDPENQRVTKPQTDMFVKIVDQNGEDDYIRYNDENQWKDADTKDGESCSIEKSYLKSILFGVTQEDIENQCK